MMEGDEDHHHHQAAAAAAAQRYLCKFCNKSFVSGKSLGGHMRGHLALISAQKLEAINDGGEGESGFDTLNKITKKGSTTVSEPPPPPPPPYEEKVNESQMLGVEEEDGGGSGQAGSYGLRENPKKSWRVSSDSKRVALNGGENFCKECGKGFSSLRALSGHMRSHSMKGKDKEKDLILNCCKKCGKGFESLRAMYGHMRSHSKKSKLQSGDQSEDDGEEIKPQPEPPTGELANPVRKKRSRTRYKIAGPSDPSAGSSSNLNSSFSTMTVDVEVEEVAMCLIMLSRGVRNWDEFNSGIGEFDSVYSRNVDYGVEFDVSAVDDDESFEGLKFKNQSELGLEKGVMMAEVVDFGHASKKLKSSGQDFVSTIGEVSCDGEEIFDAEIDGGLMKRNNNKVVEHECSICFKVFGSGQALGGHKRAHYNGTIIESSSSSSKATVTETELLEQEFAEIHKLLNLNLSVNLEDGVKGDHNAGGLKPWWVGNDLEREPLAIL